MQSLANAASSLTALRQTVGPDALPKRAAHARDSSRARALDRVVGHSLSVALLYVVLDLGAWLAITRAVGLIRQDAFSTTPSQFLFISLIQLGVLIQALWIIGGYDRNTDHRSLSYTAEHILAIGTATAFSAMLIYSLATFGQTMKPSRAVLLLSFLLFLPISLLYRRCICTHVAVAFAKEVFLVLGSSDAAVRFYKSYRNSPNRQQLQFADAGDERVGLPIAGDGSPLVENLESKLENLSESYCGIILAERIDSLGAELLTRLARTQFQQTRVYTLESFCETHWRYVPLNVIDPGWPLQTGFQLARTLPYHYFKRLFDLVGAAVALVVCAPLFTLLAVLIWLECGSPIVFCQRRMAREGKPFTMFKFRTMAVGANQECSEDIYTQRSDPRVTRVGRWLRRSRLDELPQLINVLKGEMSLIGPRAEWVRCAERYEQAIPFYHFRYLVKPGITGWAQVNYGYGASDEDAIEKLQYDLYYLRHCSLKLDAMIVLKTIHIMLFGRGR